MSKKETTFFQLKGYPGLENTGHLIAEYIPKCSLYVEPFAGLGRVHTHVKAVTKDELVYEHPAIFPEELASDHIKSWSNDGDLVLDPFAGSGTTLKMAKLNRRNFLGIEISPKYCKIIEKRLEKYNNQSIEVFCN